MSTAWTASGLVLAGRPSTLYRTPSSKRTCPRYRVLGSCVDLRHGGDVRYEREPDLQHQSAKLVWRMCVPFNKPRGLMSYPSFMSCHINSTLVRWPTYPSIISPINPNAHFSGAMSLSRRLGRVDHRSLHSNSCTVYSTSSGCARLVCPRLTTQK